MVSATVVVTGSAIAVLAVALIAYYSLTGKKVNGQAVSSLDLSGTDSRGNTIYLSLSSSGNLNYDILSPANSDGQQLLTRYESSGPSQWAVGVDSKTFAATTKWENILGSEATYTNPTMTSSGNTITLSSAGQSDLTITLDATTNAPITFGTYTVTSFNAGAFASRPTANLADPAAADIYDSPSLSINNTKRRNLGHRNLANDVNPSAALKSCLNEVAYLSYKTYGVVDYTVYINTCPSSAGKNPSGVSQVPSGGSLWDVYPIEDSANPGLVKSGSGSFCFHESQTQMCNGVLNGKTVVGFQGTSMNGATLNLAALENYVACYLSIPGYSCGNSGYQDIAYDVNIVLDNGASGYNGALGYSTSDTQVFNYCTGHSLGGARAKYAGTKGRCGNVVTFASPYVSYGSTGTPITQYQRSDKNGGSWSCCSWTWYGSCNNWGGYMDIVPQIGYAGGSNINVHYTQMNGGGALTSLNCVAGWTDQIINYGLTPTLQLHVMGKYWKYSSSDAY